MIMLYIYISISFHYNYTLLCMYIVGFVHSRQIVLPELLQSGSENNTGSCLN